MVKSNRFDNNSFSPYKYNVEVEGLVASIQLNIKRKEIIDLLNKGLEEKMFLTNPKEFQKIADLYNNMKSIDKRLNV